MLYLTYEGPAHEVAPALPEGVGPCPTSRIAHKLDGAALFPTCLTVVSGGAAHDHLPVYGCRRNGQIEAAAPSLMTLLSRTGGTVFI